MKQKARKSKKVRLNLGCGPCVCRGFVNVDKYVDIEKMRKIGVEKMIVPGLKAPHKEFEVDYDAEFVKADLTKLPFPDNYADYIECIDALEHLPFTEVYPAVKEIYRVLKPGGIVRAMTTNFDNLAALWLKNVQGKPFNLDVWRNLAEVIYGNQQHEGEFHKVPFNPQVFGTFFVESGFSAQKITLSIWPENCPSWPPLETQLRFEGSVIRTEMMMIEAVK